MITDNNEKLAILSQISNENSPLTARKRKISLLDLPEEIQVWLQSDQQELEKAKEQGRLIETKAGLQSPTTRLIYYHFVEIFFLYLAKQGQSTRIADITATMVEGFLNLPLSSISKIRGTRPEIKSTKYFRKLSKQELKAFFSRAVQAGIIRDNPLIKPLKPTARWNLVNPSPQVQADCQAFQQYLQRLIQRNLLKSSTAKTYYRYLRILLYDVEKQHTQNSAWPLELDGLFSDPKWVWRWLNKAENYDINKASQKPTRNTISRRINTIRHLWLWLKSENRVTETYIEELKELLRTKGDARIHLPKRKLQITEPLSEVEEQAIFDCIERYSPNPVLRLRDRAMIITALETTMPLGKLNQMRIENIKRMEEDIWIYEFCDASLVNELTSPAINSPGMKQTWYISPPALTSIQHYLHATDRGWSSSGLIWLHNPDTPLSIDNQSKAIRGWMKKAGCRSTHCHVLRHTGIDRLLNKYKIAPSIVQTITNYSNLDSLLRYYGKRVTTDISSIEEE